MNLSRAKLLGCVFFFFSLTLFSQVHTSYLWHLEQPIYWPETSVWNPFEYQKAWESQYLKWNNGNWYSDGQQHPSNNIQEIFGNDDRKAVYQYRTKDAVQSLLSLPEAGAQVNYSGCLMENVKSLADAGQWGYYSGWENNFITSRGWTTSAGARRMDIVGFSMNHVLSPLVSEKMLRKQIQAHRFLYGELFGTSPNYSKGYWPAECSFSERIIKALAEEGFEWSVIANSHLARTLNDYPLQFGTAGCNIDPPNPADKVATNGSNWWSGQIDGRGGTFAAPFCYQAHKAKYVDPATGQEYKITVVPMDDLLSYQNGYSLMGTGEIETHIAPYNDPAHPSMVLLAHDGDNAWGGGYDYYTHSVPNFANEAASKGYVPTTVQQFLNQHPVPENDVVKVEDGSWFNAANDWGHPQFINWLWPMYTSGYEFNPNGWTEDARNWAVLVAAENRVQMSEDLSGTVSIAGIVHPSAASGNAEKAWHYLLPAYNSGYMYYGTSLDMEVKQTLSCNKACGFADQVINANPGTDNTEPTVFIPQRYPYNPGGIGFGPNYAYQQHQNPSDFYIWTFAYDVSGIQTATIKYRLDVDGVNPLTDNDNDTYAGGAGVGAWQSVPMNYRNFPTGNVTNNPDINFFILPDYIAGEYYGQITGITEKLVDYYVEMTDGHGNISRTQIQHVYVGAGGSGSQTGVSWYPLNPTRNDVITITEYDVANQANLHWGVRVNSNWQSPVQSYWPSGSALFNGTGPAVESPMSRPVSANNNTIQIGPFNDPAQLVKAVNFVMHYSNNTWNNNSGADFYIPILNPPSTQTSAAGSVTASSAVLNGSINPNGYLTTYYFQWGTSTAYGFSTEAASLTQGTVTQSVSAAISGLPTGQEIHFRLVASNQDGTSFGDDFTFFTSGTPTLFVTPAVQQVNYSSGSVNYSVVTGLPWTAESNQLWCSVTASGTGSGNLTALFSENHSAAPRSASITVHATGLPDVSVVLTQEASGNTFNFWMANDVQTSDHSLEFDLLLLNLDGTTSFELGAVQGGILINPAILNGGTLTASIVAGTSTLNASQQPTNITFTQSQNCLKLASKAPPGSGNGSILSAVPATPSRVCRIRLSNSVPFAQATPDLAFTFSTLPYPTKVSRYVNGYNTLLVTNSSNCFTECGNSLLNPPPVLSVNPAELTVTADAGFTEFQVVSNAGWTVTVNQPWCTVTGSGFGEGQVQVNYDENTGSDSRSATISVAVQGLQPVTFVLNQSGKVNRLLQISAFLEGLYDGNGMMHPAMDENGVHWSEGTADKITLELRSAGNYETLVYSVSNVDLQLDGSAEISVPASLNQSYFLTLRHRNSLETTSAQPVSFTGSSVNYDFDNLPAVFGGNIKDSGDGHFLIFGGDANQDGIVDSTDMVMVDNDTSVFMSGYLDTDLNGDGIIDSSDMVILDNNASQFVTKVVP